MGENQMPASFLGALKDEIASLEKELAADPRFQKLESLRNALCLYQGESIGSELPTEELKAKRLTRKPSEAREKAIGLSLRYMRSLTHNDPVPTRVIFEDAIEGMVEISGKDPVSNLSAMLSQSSFFNSNGRKGWTLAHAAPEQRLPPPAPLPPAPLPPVPPSNTTPVTHGLLNGGFSNNPTPNQPVKAQEPWPVPNPNVGR